ncbi:MAG: GIY-YIG nuclease family protein [Candidatus Chisholmbacteria bacterium]|nr:GIY-YIG nuclease family protein [Candidatus Chisholmbacteria bacterium]
MRSKPWFVYIAKAQDSSLYTGISPDPKIRENIHNSGKGAKSLRGKLPVTLVYCEQHPDKGSAAKRESLIKNWKREYKIKLINKFVEL